MIVCVCNRVSDRDIALHVRGGMGFDDIQLELGVASQCGRCEPCARAVVAQCSADHPAAALRHEEQASACMTRGADLVTIQAGAASTARA